ncbi:uncharacterized protein LOC122505377 isoform X2 [Leptopilina heterotoma]|uniref:uncharacterized protein LOC122505377 isoform X2 n=1 Tax=Leptopilina heterotoma TaxID=63436 RepID=UPI001CA8C168|nr:uncharacterized protein LOC122505377 isoform X2 [Leptopilina heterotoma]
MPIDFRPYGKSCLYWVFILDIRKLVSLNARRMLGGDSRTQRYSVSTTQLSRFVFILYKKLFRNKYYKFFYVFKAPGHHLEEFKRRHIKRIGATGNTCEYCGRVEESISESNDLFRASTVKKEC